MYIAENAWPQKYRHLLHRKDSVLPNLQGGKAVFNLNSSSAFSNQVQFLLFWNWLSCIDQKGSCIRDKEMKEKRPIATVQTALQMSSGKKCKKIDFIQIENFYFFNVSQWHFWSKCQYTLCYMRESLSLRLNINMKRGNALQFYLALHLRMPEDFVSINNPCTGPRGFQSLI